MDQSEDLAQIHRIASGDTLALARIYDLYNRLVFSVALHITADTHSAEEVVQDVFIQVWKKADTYDPVQGKVVTWITSIARHRAIDQYRRINVRAEGHSVAWDDCCSDNPDGEAEVEPALVGTEDRQMMLRALAQLPPDQRDAIALAYFKGLTQQEIAAHLKEPLGTVKTRIRLGMQKLRAALAVNVPDE